jgi:hypothetical protein
MSVSFWQRAASADATAFDVAIIGGGFIGCSTAYWLHRRRSRLRVAIVEAQAIGHGASGRNAGFLLQGTDTDYLTDVARHGPQRAKRFWQFTRDNRNLIEAELQGRAFDFRPSGSMTVAGTEDEDDRLQAAVSPLRSIGAPVVYLSPEETERRIDAENFWGSLFVTSGAMVDPLRLVQHVTEASRAQVFEYQPARAVTSAGDHYRIETEGRCIEAGQVAYTLNAHLPQLVPACASYVRPVRAQMLATPPTRQRLRFPVYTHEGAFYIRQGPGGEVLLGGARHRHAETEVGYEDVVTPAVQNNLERYLRTHFPWAQGVDVTQRWSGTMGFSPDGLPVVDFVPGQPGNVWAAGFTGHGMSCGFRIGQLIAAHLLGDTNPEGHDLFTASRFDRASIEAFDLVGRTST